MKKKILVFLVLSLTLDMASKFLISANIAKGEVIHVFKGLDFTNLNNSGCAFSLLEGKNPLLVFIALVMLYILVRLIKEYNNNFINALAFGLLFGGIIGNLFDRVLFGHVRDFIKLTFIDFPIFNLADAFITIGVVVLIFKSFFERDKNGTSNE